MALKDFGDFIEMVITTIAESGKVKERKFQISDDNTELDMLVTYESGRTETIEYIRKDRQPAPRDVDTTPIDRQPRRCRLSTPASACEDRNCYEHRDVPGSQRSPLFYRF